MVRRAELRGAAYVTPEGFEALRAELAALWTDERRKVTAEVAEAAAQGDRSENAEYIYGKKRLREIDRRIRYLSKRLDELTVVNEPPPDRDRVYFGAWLEVEDEAGEERRFRLVGPDESDVAEGRLSIDSPLGRALLGRREGDEIELPPIARGAGAASGRRRRYQLLSIRYAPPADDA